MAVYCRYGLVTSRQKRGIERSKVWYAQCRIWVNSREIGHGSTEAPKCRFYLCATTVSFTRLDWLLITTLRLVGNARPCKSLLRQLQLYNSQQSPTFHGFKLRSFIIISMPNTPYEQSFFNTFLFPTKTMCLYYSAIEFRCLPSSSTLLQATYHSIYFGIYYTYVDYVYNCKIYFSLSGLFINL